MPPFSAVAKKPQAQDAAPRIEEALVARLEEAEWQQVADEIHSELATVGGVLLRIEYEQEYRNSPRMQLEVDEEAFSALIDTGMDPSLAVFDAVTKDDDGNEKFYLGWKKVLVHAGVKFGVICLEDALVLPATARRQEECFAFGERLLIRGHDLIKGAKDGKYIQAAVDELMQFGPGMDAPDRLEKLDVQGVMPVGPRGKSDPSRDYYLCYDLCYRFDANDDGEEEWVNVTLAYHSNIVLKVQYSPYEHGSAPFVLFSYLPRANELWGMGIAEKLASIQDAATATLNQIIDHQDLVIATYGTFFYDGTTGFNPDKFVAQLGRPIKVDSVEGIKPFVITPLPPESYTLLQQFKDFAELLTASSNPSLGKATDTQKTLGEVQIVTAASGMLFEEIAARVARDWAKVWDQVRWLEAQYAENGEVQYRKTAAPNGLDFDVITKEQLLADVDLQPAALRQLSDMQSRVQQAVVTQNTVLQNPLMQMVGPQAAQSVMMIMLDNFLQAVSYPQRERIMATIRQAIEAIQMLENAQMAAEMQQGMMPGALPPGQVSPEAAQTTAPVPPPLQAGVGTVR